MYLYHGSDEVTVKSLINGKIDVTKGGGEIGRGFYLGDMLHVAKAWAWNKHDSKVVLEVEVHQNDIKSLRPLSLTYKQVA